MQDTGGRRQDTEDGTQGTVVRRTFAINGFSPTPTFLSAPWTSTDEGINAFGRGFHGHCLSGRQPGGVIAAPQRDQAVAVQRLEL